MFGIVVARRGVVRVTALTHQQGGRLSQHATASTRSPVLRVVSDTLVKTFRESVFLVTQHKGDPDTRRRAAA